MAKLCVNIDHVATVRQARMDPWPDPVKLAAQAEKAGAIGITAHLREDRRHVQDLDIRRLRKSVKGKFNLEMAATDAMVNIACRILPDEATLVPEKRRELTTEGGLDVAGPLKRITKMVSALKRKGIVVSMFIDPVAKQVRASKDCGADYIELHTGSWAQAFIAKKPGRQKRELKRLKTAAVMAHGLGLGVNAGHGLTTMNVGPVAALPHIEDLNIGHFLISRSIEVGLAKATREMIAAIKKK